MFRLKHRTALISDVSSWTLTLIEREDDTKSWGNFSNLFLTQCHANLGVGLHIYSWPRQPSIYRDASLRCYPKMLSSKMLSF
jgi:hypothetical protein